MRPGRLVALLLLALAAILPSQAEAQRRGLGPQLIFPTDNESVVWGDDEGFYMWLVRHVGRTSYRTWEGGAFGFVRNARSTPAGYVFTRFHEGVDIRPVRRDESGEPLDAVYAIDDGRVVYTNEVERRSDYGRYVVVQHDWDGVAFYALYAHLAELDVYIGQPVRQGSRLGLLGHSGPGLDRERAHLHFEINVMLNRHFDNWYRARYPRRRNYHGLYHGSNLAGLDPVRLLTALRRDPRASVLEVVRDQPEELTVHLPGGRPPDLVRRYSWLCAPCDRSLPSWSPGWEVGLTRAGFPLRVEPTRRDVRQPELVYVTPEIRREHLYSRLYRRSRDGEYTLSTQGMRLLSLLAAGPMEAQVPDW